MTTKASTHSHSADIIHADSHKVSSKAAKAEASKPAPADDWGVKYDLPEYFWLAKNQEMVALAQKANATGEEQSTHIETEIPGSGNKGSVTIFAKPKANMVHLSTPHMDLIQQWFGHLKRVYEPEMTI